MLFRDTTAQVHLPRGVWLVAAKPMLRNGLRQAPVSEGNSYSRPRLSIRNSVEVY